MTVEQNSLRQTGSRTGEKGGWVHAALTGGQSGDLREIPDLPPGSYVWMLSEDPRSQFGSPDRGAMPQGQGDYEDLAKILFKLNGYRPGPVCGWYVIVRTNAGRGWAVGQLCANAFKPVQVFEDMIYSSEAEARARATSLRSNNPGPIRRDNQSVAATDGDYARIFQTQTIRKGKPAAVSRQDPVATKSQIDVLGKVASSERSVENDGT
jgi:hypothetical protein